MSKRSAAFISYLFHPLLFPTYAVLLIIAVNPHLFGFYKFKDQMLWVIIIFIFTFICPVMWMLMMKRLELITDFKMENAKERIIPYIAVATFYLWMFKLFKPTGEPTPYSNEIISHMMLGASFSIFIGFFINIFRKIDIHSIGVGAFLGLILCLMRMSDYDLKFLFIFALLFAGLVGTAQLSRSGDHNNNKIWAGYLTGFIGQFFSFTLGQMLFG
jgi:membrane-associated HD superfamily phosphohydrolase